VPSSQCIACHAQLTATTGDDISIGFDWRATMMANSARDPYWHAAVRREIIDHPAAQAAIEDTCSTCHMPMARFDAAAAGGHGEVFANLATAAPQHALAIDGVSCTVCHQISADGLGEHASFDGGFRIEPARDARVAFGPHEVDAGRQSVMRSAASFAPTPGSHIQSSELCATCHTLFTTALDAAGQPIGELPEQVPYQEWLHSDYRTTNSCQSCHMPEVAGDAPIASVLAQPRQRVSQHTFLGSNAFMLSLLGKYRGELGVAALPQELAVAAAETRQFLATRAATLSVAAAQQTRDGLELALEVVSLTGHKLPTAYPSRRAWLHVVVKDQNGGTVFESGALRPDGSIAGNDNDADAARFEPHYELLTVADQVQIYEAIMVDSQDSVTTGLLSAVRFVKDNRVLPRGFDKTTAEPAVAPVLTAAALGTVAKEGYGKPGGEKHGVFTWAVLDALKHGDANDNKVIELSELAAHVQGLVPTLSAELGRGHEAEIGDRAAITIPAPEAAIPSAPYRQSARFGSKGENFTVVGRWQ
jgi:hypothetical protein